MRFLKRGLSLIICVLLVLSATCVSFAEEEKEYIVYLNEEVSLFSTEGKDYCLLSEEELSEALSMGVVDFYEENYIVELHEGDIDLFSEEIEEEVLDPKQAQYKWDMDLINAYYPREKGYFGENVKIAVIDSGCNYHVELKNNLAEGYNMIDKNTDVTDNIGHGTGVAGVIAAEINTVGISGVAPKCTIIPIKAFDTDYKTKTSLVAEAIKKAADDFKCDIINLSLGSSGYTETLKSAVDYVISKGVIVIASSGNDGTEAYSYPASFENVISVGAVDENKMVCDYSQHNDMVTLVAPGGTEEKYIITLSATNSEKYAGNLGTSFSAPIVSGIAALLKSADNSLTQEDFFEIAEKVSVDLGDSGFDIYYGHGLADAEAYLNYWIAESGDTNADGKITGEDAFCIINELAKKKNAPLMIKPAVADVDSDGVVTLKDAFIIIKRVNTPEESGKTQEKTE